MKVAIYYLFPVLQSLFSRTMVSPLVSPGARCSLLLSPVNAAISSCVLLLQSLAVSCQPSVLRPAGMACEIYVCQAGPCRAHGGEAVLTEIEELADTLGGCRVRASGCLGYCSQAPNALVRKKGVRGRFDDDEEVHTRISSFEASVKVMERATGKRASLEVAGEKFALLRSARARQHAVSIYHWNAALRGLAEQAETRPLLRFELQSLLAKAGFQSIPDPMGTTMPRCIDNYSQWSLEKVELMSKHSAVFTFTCRDRKRGTPHPRGRGTRPDMITWHTTLLAEIGPNTEGPLPWTEREYTPISSAKEWEAGRCELLVKVYRDGAATSWLHRRMVSMDAPMQVWLSQPVKTLSVPDLVAEGSSFQPASVLLILAGTGVVALPQILAHRDPLQKLGVPTHKRDQLLVPIDLVLSCREDDVLMLPQIAQWCRAGEARGLRNCTLLLTAAVANKDAAPFPEAPDGDEQEDTDSLRGLANARLLRSRLDSDIVAEAVLRMPKPCRVVVSGPDGFNSAARQMLAGLINTENVTVLSA